LFTKFRTWRNAVNQGGYRFDFAMVAITILVGLALAISLFMTLSGESEASKIAALLKSGSPQFVDLFEANNINCEYHSSIGKHKVYGCAWENGNHEGSHYGYFTSLSGFLARVSEGGESGHAPESDAQATEMVNAIIDARVPGSSLVCQEITSLASPYVVVEHTYACISYSSFCTPIDNNNGEPQRLLWTWTAEGFIMQETLDNYKESEEGFDAPPAYPKCL
jgi:hypothetical protein